MKYGAIPRDLWQQPRFKTLRSPAKLVMTYVLSSPLGNSAHLYRVGPDEIGLACGIPLKAAHACLETLVAAGFIAYDFDRELLWIEAQMLAELGPLLQPGDKRITFLARLTGELPDCEIRRAFLERYTVPCLVVDHAGAVHRFGFVDDDREWTLDGPVTSWREEAKRAGRVIPEPAKLRDCPKCQAVFTGRECPSCGWYAKPKGVQVQTLNGELIEVGANVSEAAQERLRFYLELLGECAARRKKPGYAAYSYREKFGEWPPRAWQSYPAAQPGPEVHRWVQSRLIAFARTRQGEAA